MLIAIILGVLYVNSPLDFESQTTYRLTVRATDLVTSSGSNTHVLIRLKDSNDCRPRFTQATYHIRLAEGYMPSQGGLLASLRASDNDTGINAILTYELIPDDAPVRISADGERISSRRISRHISTEDLELDIIGSGAANNNNNDDDVAKGLFIELGDQEGNDDEDDDVGENDDDYEDVTVAAGGEVDVGGNIIIGPKRKLSKGSRRKPASSRRLHDEAQTSPSDSTPIKDRMVNEDATSNQRGADVSRYFMVRPNDGSIVLKQMVDYERAHEFRFSVVVKDSGIPALSSTARVIVEVVAIAAFYFLHTSSTTIIIIMSCRATFWKV
ncbi:Protocadherin Fat 2 [Orchesella cincta]|uniref:Protocadherin Fat 2 n=1 Tax=Orchesella cincta TaxID=48709 RepID=A0A1D2MU16_ORCCI|nr:Protocadherin Fat 2 [Orchesella cincta]